MADANTHHKITIGKTHINHPEQHPIVHLLGVTIDKLIFQLQVQINNKSMQSLWAWRQV